jgi:hypothetical protein
MADLKARFTHLVAGGGRLDALRCLRQPGKEGVDTVERTFAMASIVRSFVLWLGSHGLL